MNKTGNFDSIARKRIDAAKASFRFFLVTSGKARFLVSSVTLKKARYYVLP